MKIIQSSLLGFVLLLALAQSFSGAGTLTGGATEFTQIANNAQLMAQVGEQIATVQELYNQFQIMEQQAQMFGNTLTGDSWNQARALIDAVNWNGVITYTAQNIDEEFRSIYDGYDEYEAKKLKDYGPQTMGQKFSDWDEANKNSVVAALETIKITASMIESESRLMETYKSQIETSAGTNELLQTLALIAAQQADQLQELRLLIATQIQLHSNYYALQGEKEAMEKGRVVSTQKEAETTNETIILGNGKGF